jgi:Glycerate kinase
MDGGVGLLEASTVCPAPTTVLCDVQTTLYDAPRLFGPQKGATPEQVDELERRLRANGQSSRRTPISRVRGAAGGLGAALASLGAELVPGASAVVELAGFDPQPYGLVVTGEGRVDLTTAEGNGPAEVVHRCTVAGVPCVVFGGIVEELVPGAETIALSGDPARGARPLRARLRLGTRLLDAAG